MVPVGPLAFFPGKLIHTNEILVSLGDNWFTERSAKQAAAIAKRREEFVDEKIRESRREIKEFGERRKLVPEIFADEKEQVEKAMFNEDGEEIVDIKEELSADQVPDFHEQTSESSARSDEDVLAQRAKEALEAKRARVIQSLSDSSSSLTEAKDSKPLGAEEQRIMDLLNQFDSDDEDVDEEASDHEQQSEGDEDGDAFSDEDRANAARDDDEDDYNDHAPQQQRRHSHRHRGNSSDDDDADISGDTILNVVEKHRSPPASGPPPRADDSHKGILKQSTPISLFKKKRADEATSSGKGSPKSVSFNSTAVAYAKPSQDLLDESNVDEDINRVADLISMIGMSGQDKGKATAPPKIAIIDKAPAIASSSSKVVSTPPIVGKVKPNVSNAGVRSQGPTASSSSPAPKSPVKPKSPKAQQPMKGAVVERSAVPSETNQETVDEEMHAREIAQAYNRMRFVQLASGKLDEAADVAERILADVPGVTLIESKAQMDDGDEDDRVAGGDYQRIELPEEPSPLSAGSVGERPPEVIHQPTTKPKMSRFKAQRLGLED
ncbi:uri1, prefoldin-like chaperone [Coemansia sp. RSA 1694]|nr:uri1, prefoldin-like chaperone [Coemansia sp. RSA 1694]